MRKFPTGGRTGCRTSLVVEYDYDSGQWCCFKEGPTILNKVKYWRQRGPVVHWEHPDGGRLREPLAYVAELLHAIAIP